MRRVGLCASLLGAAMMLVLVPGSNAASPPGLYRPADGVVRRTIHKDE